MYGTGTWTRLAASGEVETFSMDPTDGRVFLNPATLLSLPLSSVSIGAVEYRPSPLPSSCSQGNCIVPEWSTATLGQSPSVFVIPASQATGQPIEVQIRLQWGGSAADGTAAGRKRRQAGAMTEASVPFVVPPPGMFLTDITSCAMAWMLLKLGISEG